MAQKLRSIRWTVLHEEVLEPSVPRVPFFHCAELRRWVFIVDGGYDISLKWIRPLKAVIYRDSQIPYTIIDTFNRFHVLNVQISYTQPLSKSLPQAFSKL